MEEKSTVMVGVSKDKGNTHVFKITSAVILKRGKTAPP